MRSSLATLIDQLHQLGLRRGDSVIVHCSFRAVGAVDGGPRGLLAALQNVLLPEGALLFPNLNIPHEFTASLPPRFDLRRASVRSLGVLADLFKREVATQFSLHPTHSLMGCGEGAPALLAGHERAGVPCGVGTPWEKNALAGGKVLLVGVDQRRNTTYHCVEEQIEPCYRLSLQPIAGGVVVDGRLTVVRSRLHLWGIEADFNIVNDLLAAQGLLVRGRLGCADTVCLDAGGFIRTCLEFVRRDPLHFVIGAEPSVRPPSTPAPDAKS